MIRPTAPIVNAASKNSKNGNPSKRRCSVRTGGRLEHHLGAEEETALALIDPGLVAIEVVGHEL